MRHGSIRTAGAVGKEKFLTWRKKYPAKLDFRIRRISHAGDLSVTENLISYDGSPWMFTIPSGSIPSMPSPRRTGGQPTPPTRGTTDRRARVTRALVEIEMHAAAARGSLGRAAPLVKLNPKLA